MKFSWDWVSDKAISAMGLQSGKRIWTSVLCKLVNSNNRPMKRTYGVPKTGPSHGAIQQI